MFSLAGRDADLDPDVGPSRDGHQAERVGDERPLVADGVRGAEHAGAGDEAVLDEGGGRGGPQVTEVGRLGRGEGVGRVSAEGDDHGHRRKGRENQHSDRDRALPLRRIREIEELRVDRVVFAGGGVSGSEVVGGGGGHGSCGCVGASGGYRGVVAGSL